ncbi:MAG: hypothetical protein ACI9T7_000502 [Oleiphilaceae bacterium]|jgi:hypothetical protein
MTKSNAVQALIESASYLVTAVAMLDSEHMIFMLAFMSLWTLSKKYKN